MSIVKAVAKWRVSGTYLWKLNLIWRQEHSMDSKQRGDLNIFALQDKEPIGMRQQWRLGDYLRSYLSNLQE